MKWFVVRHPQTGGVGVVAECALLIHKAAGWLRVSEPIGEMDKDQVDPAAYADAPDLDAAPASKTKPAASPAPAETSSKEN